MNNNVHLDIDSIIRRKSISHALDFTTSLPRCCKSKNHKFIRLPFLGNFSFQLARTLKTFGFRHAFYSLLTTGKFFSKLKDSVPLDEKSGVYKLSCDSCPAVYIGQTGRKLKTRVSEHNPNAPINSSSVLHEESFEKKRLALETIEIVKAGVNNLELLNDVIPTSILASTVYNNLNTI